VPSRARGFSVLPVLKGEESEPVDMSEPSSQRIQARGDAYRFLSALFCLPDLEALLGEDVYGALENALKEICPAAAPHAAEMARSAAETTEEDLRIEYARLFVGPHRLPAPPYGSVYLGAGRGVMGESTLQVLDYYSEEGVDVDGEFHELPDHISAELEFAYVLMSRQLAALANGWLQEAGKYEQKHRRFLEDHLIPWIGPFCQAILDSARNPYFESLARCLQEFVGGSEAQLLAVESGDTPG
jgi:TorA maturation chaperone TorD